MVQDKHPSYAEITKKYTQRAMIKRIEAFFLDNLGKAATREQIIQVATDPKTGKEPENWHQRVSELRTDYGYTILSQRNRGYLKVSEYLMPDATKHARKNKRVRPTAPTWAKVLKEYGHRCAWNEDGTTCSLKAGDIDPVGGGTVRLTPDHKKPHSVNADVDRESTEPWKPLCQRHQVMKKNFWDDETGWLNLDGIIQSASDKDKKRVYEFLKEYFGK